MPISRALALLVTGAEAVGSFFLFLGAGGFEVGSAARLGLTGTPRVDAPPAASWREARRAWLALMFSSRCCSLAYRKRSVGWHRAASGKKDGLCVVVHWFGESYSPSTPLSPPIAFATQQTHATSPSRSRHWAYLRPYLFPQSTSNNTP